MYSYMYYISTSTRGFLPCYSHFFTSATTVRTSQMWLLYAFSYRKSCDIREAKFSRRPVKDDYPDSPLIWSSPFLTSLLLKFASGVFFLTRHEFCLDGQKMELNKKSVNMCRKSMNDKNHKTCAKNHRKRCLVHSKH